MAGAIDYVLATWARELSEFTFCGSLHAIEELKGLEDVKVVLITHQDLRHTFVILKLVSF